MYIYWGSMYIYIYIYIYPNALRAIPATVPGMKGAKQQITATQITQNKWDNIGTAGCKHVLGQNSNNTSQLRTSHITVGPTF